MRKHRIIVWILWGIVIYIAGSFWVDVFSAELPMKIDTIRVDTVGFEITCDTVHDWSTGGQYWDMRSEEYKKSIGIIDEWVSGDYKVELKMFPTLHYTTDTSYWLTEEQIQLLTVPTPTDNAIRRIPDFPGRYFPRDTVLTINTLNARIDSLVKVVDGLRSLIIFHRSSPTDHNIRSYNDSIRPEWNLGKSLEHKTPDRE